MAGRPAGRPAVPRPATPAEHWQTFAAAVRADLRGFAWEGARPRRALTAGIATALAVLAALALDLDYPMWSGMSAFVVIQGSARATAVKSLLRIAGTFGGAILAVAFLAFAGGNDYLLVAALFAAVSYPLYRSYRSAYPYAWLLAAMTTGIVLMAALADPGVGLAYAAYRAAEIAVGAAVACLAAYLLLPAAGDPAIDLALVKQPSTPPEVAARTAVEAGCGILLVALAYAWFDLPGFSAAAVSMTRLADPNPELGRHRGFLRLVGCLLGAAAGLAAVAASIGTLVGMALVLFAAAAVFGYLFSGGPASAYAGMQAGLAFIIAFAPAPEPATTLDPAVDRLAGVVLALAVFWLVDAVLAPAATPPAAAAAAGTAAVASRGEDDGDGKRG